MQSQLGWLPRLLFLNDSSYPTGSYGHSAGLEYAIQRGLVQNGDDLASWMQESLVHSLVSLDARACAKAHSICANFGSGHPAAEPAARGYETKKSAGATPATSHDGIVADLITLNIELAAFRSGRVQREASAQMGRSLCRNVVASTGEFRIAGWFPRFIDQSRGNPDLIQYPIAWAIVCAATGVPLSACVSSLLSQNIRQMIQVALKVMPIGQTEAFAILDQVSAGIPTDLDWLAEMQLELRAFAPGLELSGLGHDNLAKRYFRS